MLNDTKIVSELKYLYFTHIIQNKWEKNFITEFTVRWPGYLTTWWSFTTNIAWSMWFGSSQIERNSYLYDMVKILSDECIISLICARYGWDMSDNGHIWSRYLWYEWDLFNSIHILVVSLWYGLNIAIFGWDL